jgi:hypothetical protein
MALPPVPTALSETSDDEAVVEAIYFTVRVLRNAGRGYSATPVSPESSEAAHELAESTVREIEAREGPVPLMADERLSEYIQTLEGLLRARYERPGRDEQQRIASILDELRVAGP